MPLPAAVARRAAEATRLMTVAAATRQPAGATPTPTPAQPAAADVTTLTQQLSDTQELLRKATEAQKALEGKYNAELPRSQTELRAANADLKKAQERVKELESAAKAKLDALSVTGLTEEDTRLAGPDLVKVIAKTAREIAEGVFTERLKPFTQRVDLLEQMSEEGYSVMLDEIPNFAVQNNDPKFMAWLNQADPRSGRLRMDLVKRAESLRQAYLVIEIFAAFREGREIGAPKAAEPAPQPRTGPEAFVDAPTGGGASTTENLVDGQGKRLWTQPQIKQHYDEKTQGAWRGKEAEWRTLEIDIFAARKEGRLR